jgi:peptidoglycan/LPS O-acetylase OafA/YrhL
MGYLFANFLMLPGILPIVPLITVAWSLSYELSFYLTLPLLIKWLHIPAWPRPARIAFFLALATACLWPWFRRFAGIHAYRCSPAASC